MRTSKAGRWIGGPVALVATLALAAPAAAHPVVTVTIAGTPAVGATLTATASATDAHAAPVTITYQWQRCNGTANSTCKPITGATATTYRVGEADIGQRIAVKATGKNTVNESTAKWSAFTAVVPVPPAPTPTPEPTPEPTPAPTPAPSPEPSPTPAPDPEPVPAGDPIPGAPAGATTGGAAAAAPRFLDPFPVVRIKGALAPGGARVSLLRVRGPAGSTVAVRCDGRGCPRRRWSPKLGRIAALERFLRAGVRITIQVARPGMIGKHVRIVIRDGKAPYRRDACLLPDGKGAAPCPPS